MVLKLDMAKAYDRISWYFIIQMLQCFRFFEWSVDQISYFLSLVFGASERGQP